MQHLYATVVSGYPEMFLRIMGDAYYSIGKYAFRIIGLVLECFEIALIPVEIVESAAICGDPNVTIFILLKIADNIIAETVAES